MTTAGEAVGEVFRAFRERYGIPGVAWGVISGGDLVAAGGEGVRAVGGGPAEPGTAWRIASMTKTVTAMCVLSLRDAGALSLEDPITRHVPEAAGLQLPTCDSPCPTLRDLLSMSAGLVDDNAWGDRQLDMPEEAFSALLRGGVPLSSPPATGYEYSNLGYAVLGRAVANLAGSPFGAFATQTVLAPLGMTATAWDVVEVPEERRARGYRRADGGFEEEPPLGHGAFGAMGGLWSTVTDFARLTAFHLSAWPPRDDPEAGPLRRSSVREMAQLARLDVATVQRGDHPDGWLAPGYGLGLMCGVHPRWGRVAAHSGGLPGWGSRVAWVPDAGVGVVGFANLTYAPVREAVTEVLDVLDVRARIAPPPPLLVPLQDRILQLYERWDDAGAEEVAAENFFLDVTRARRAEEMARLRRELGACRAVGEARAAGELRGEWRMACQRGDLDVQVSLSPTTPPRLQTLSLQRVERPGG